MRWLIPLLAACSSIEGTYEAHDTSLALHADGSFSLALSAQLTVDGHYSLYDDTLVLAHERLSLATPTAIVVSEQITDDTLCLPLSAHDLCVPTSHSLTVRFTPDDLLIDNPPFASVPHLLTRKK